MRNIVGQERLMEFGLRRAQGPNGGMSASRAAYIGGFDVTSNVLAGKEFALPVAGTMSHSWIMAFDNELEAFATYARLFPDNLVLLVDTYNTASGVDNAIIIGKKLQQEGKKLKAIRLDSGDLNSLSKMAREKLNQAGLTDTQIYASGDITEERLIDLKSVEAPIDGWGVGTHLTTAYEQPALDMVYKLGAIYQNNQWHYKLKCSDNHIKTSDPGVLQVRRFYENNKWIRDVIYHEHLGVDSSGNFKDLLRPVFKDGKLVGNQPDISTVRSYCMGQVKEFNASKGASYIVQRDPKLLALKNELMQ
jgi:nicotinate phosphoribosyltransferase